MKCRTRIKKYFVTLFSILLFVGCATGEEYDFAVEGIHYLDNSLVRIKIKDGKILDIIKIKNLSEENRGVI
ncbi:MAG: hypothetical protein GXZ19_07520, partial [Bacteroidales bacterium]|nr:hypothetical protein [Bacteroidales bacterium]